MRRGESYTAPSGNRKCRNNIILKPTNFILLQVSCTDKTEAPSEVFKYEITLSGVGSTCR
jgi:hypothetical protein